MSNKNKNVNASTELIITYSTIGGIFVSSIISVLRNLSLRMVGNNKTTIILSNMTKFET